MGSYTNCISVVVKLCAGFSEEACSSNVSMHDVMLYFIMWYSMVFGFARFSTKFKEDVSWILLKPLKSFIWINAKYVIRLPLREEIIEKVFSKVHKETMTTVDFFFRGIVWFAVIAIIPCWVFALPAHWVSVTRNEYWACVFLLSLPTIALLIWAIGLIIYFIFKIQNTKGFIDKLFNMIGENTLEKQVVDSMKKSNPKKRNSTPKPPPTVPPKKPEC